MPTWQLGAGQGGGHGAESGPLAHGGAGHHDRGSPNQRVVLQADGRRHAALTVDGAAVHQVGHVAHVHPVNGTTRVSTLDGRSMQRSLTQISHREHAPQMGWSQRLMLSP